MSKFAKLFDVQDTQVLYVLKTNDEGYPQVEMSSLIDGVRVSASPTFSPKDDSQPWNEDMAWTLANKFFDGKDQAQAEVDHQNIAAMLEGQ